MIVILLAVLVHTGAMVIVAGVLAIVFFEGYEKSASNSCGTRGLISICYGACPGGGRLRRALVVIVLRLFGRKHLLGLEE